MDLQNWRLRLERAISFSGLTKTQVARRADISETTLTHHTSGRTKQPPAMQLERLAAVCGVSPQWLLSGIGEMIPQAPGEAAEVVLDGIRQWRDVPVFGAAQGGYGGAAVDFTAAIDHAVRPIGMTAADIYGLWVTGDSMVPRYYHGEFVFVSRSRPCRDGDFVVVHLALPAQRQTWIKRLLWQSVIEIVTEQFNPAGRHKFPRNQVVQMHRVLTTAEIAGF